jgi:hypothetical protein
VGSSLRSSLPGETQEVSPIASDHHGAVLVGDLGTNRQDKSLTANLPLMMSEVSSTVDDAVCFADDAKATADCSKDKLIVEHGLIHALEPSADHILKGGELTSDFKMLQLVQNVHEQVVNQPVPDPCLLGDIEKGEKIMQAAEDESKRQLNGGKPSQYCVDLQLDAILVATAHGVGAHVAGAQELSTTQVGTVPDWFQHSGCDLSLLSGFTDVPGATKFGDQQQPYSSTTPHAGGQVTSLLAPELTLQAAKEGENAMSVHGVAASGDGDGGGAASLGAHEPRGWLSCLVGRPSLGMPCPGLALPRSGQWLVMWLLLVASVIFGMGFVCGTLGSHYGYSTSPVYSTSPSHLGKEGHPLQTWAGVLRAYNTATAADNCRGGSMVETTGDGAMLEKRSLDFMQDTTYHAPGAAVGAHIEIHPSLHSNDLQGHKGLDAHISAYGGAVCKVDFTSEGLHMLWPCGHLNLKSGSNEYGPAAVGVSKSAQQQAGLSSGNEHGPSTGTAGLMDGLSVKEMWAGEDKPSPSPPRSSRSSARRGRSSTRSGRSSARNIRRLCNSWSRCRVRRESCSKVPGCSSEGDGGQHCPPVLYPEAGSPGTTPCTRPFPASFPTSLPTP